jgi:hypothetical protein
VLLSGQLAVVGLLWLHLALSWSHTSVEAATEQCYARTLLEGGGLALQPGATRGYGFDGLLWLGLLAAAQAVGLPGLLAAKLLGATLASLALLLLPALSARLAGRGVRLVDLAPGFLLALNPTLGVHAAGGLESSLVLLLLVATLRLFLRREAGLWTCLPLSLLPLVTPLAPAAMLALGAAWLLARATSGRAGSWRDLLWPLVPALAYAALLLWSYSYFADPWPGVITAREALPETRLGSPQALARGLELTGGLMRGWGATAPLLALALIGALRPTRYWGRFAVLALGFFTLAAVVAVGGDASGRRALPAALAVALLFGGGLEVVLAGLLRLVRPTWLQRFAVGAVVVGLHAAPVAAALQLGRPSPLRRAEAVAESLREVVNDLDLTPERVTVMTDAPGVMAWRRFRVVDASGVTDPAIRRYNGNRRPLELGQLVLRDRRPDILVESHPWRHVHGFTSYPEVRRRFEPLSIPGRPDLAVSVSRGLLLDEAPWTARKLRVELGDGLLLLGVRAEPGCLVLLWTTARNGPAARTVRLSVGRWSRELDVGPRVYPLPRWRAGEVVRQVVRIPREAARGPVRVGGNRIDVDPRLTRLEPGAWVRRELDIARAGPDGPERAETLVWLWRNPRTVAPEVLSRVLARIGRLARRNLLREAASQAAVARASLAPTADLARVTRELADRACRQAGEHIRWSRWSLAYSCLQAAAVVDPGSPWIRRWLEEARSRLPAAGTLVKTLELELASRRMVLAPSPARLSRLMQAQLALGRPREAVAALQAWGGHHGRRSRFLLAKAMAGSGRLSHALGLLEELLEDRPVLESRRCPSWFPLQPEALRARLRWLLKRDPAPVEVPAREPPAPLGGRARLLASCVRWSPGKPVTVTLYVHQPEERELSLELRFGPRRRPLSIPASPVPLRRLSVPLHLPPATHRIRLRRPDDGELELGSVSVGPEANFGFELPSYAPWHRQGTAFGAAPVAGRSARWRFLAGYEGERFADSFVNGFDRATGTLTSPPFLLRGSHLMMLVAGGRDREVGVDLRVEGRRVHRVRGTGREVLEAVFLPITEHRGRRARIVIWDRSSRPWGHIAVDEIRQIEGPAPGVAP